MFKRIFGKDFGKLHVQLGDKFQCMDNLGPCHAEIFIEIDHLYICVFVFGSLCKVVV